MHDVLTAPNNPMTQKTWFTSIFQEHTECSRQHSPNPALLKLDTQLHTSTHPSGPECLVLVRGMWGEPDVCGSRCDIPPSSLHSPLPAAGCQDNMKATCWWQKGPGSPINCVVHSSPLTHMDPPQGKWEKQFPYAEHWDSGVCLIW